MKSTREISTYLVLIAFAVLFLSPPASPAGDSHTVQSDTSQPLILWDPQRPVPKASDIPELENVRFHLLKQREPELDGYNWLHGVAVVRHKGILFTSWGHNKGKENTVTEIVQGRRSPDGGRTWSTVEMLASGGESTGVSHGSFLSYRGQLWAFFARFRAGRGDVQMEAFLFDEQGSAWQSRGIVAGDGFWPMAEPQRMQDGNWIMAGLIVGGENPAGIAISHGDDFTAWDVVAIPNSPEVGRMWGETAVIVDDEEVVAIARYRDQAMALASTSCDYGRTWTPMRVSNLPMAGSKPYAGMLSTGQRYLICTTTADSGHKRTPLTIAVTRPGEKLFTTIYTITNRTLRDNPENKRPYLSYPYAIELDRHLYVAYSASLQSGNLNDAELATIPITQLENP